MKNMYISMEVKELKQNIVNVINNSNLPFCIVQLVFLEVSNAVNEMAKQEYENDMAKLNEESNQKQPETNHEEPEG